MEQLLRSVSDGNAVPLDIDMGFYEDDQPKDNSLPQSFSIAPVSFRRRYSNFMIPRSALQPIAIVGMRYYHFIDYFRYNGKTDSLNALLL